MRGLLLSALEEEEDAVVTEEGAGERDAVFLSEEAASTSLLSFPLPRCGVVSKDEEEGGGEGEEDSATPFRSLHSLDASCFPPISPSFGFLLSFHRSVAVSEAPETAQQPNNTKVQEVKNAGQGVSVPNLSPVVPSAMRTLTKKATSQRRRRRSQGRGKKRDEVWMRIWLKGRERMSVRVFAFLVVSFPFL